MKIGIVGGGASGMMAAAAAAEKAAIFSDKIEIYLIERNPFLGCKVLLSGGGRCNLTTGIDDIKTLMKKYPRGSNFLKTAMYEFPPNKTREWFTSHGLPLKTEEDMRVFPVSNKARDVINLFEKIFTENNVKILFNHEVIKISKKDNEFLIEFANNHPSLTVNKLILTTGGRPLSGIENPINGYSFAKDLGHKITKLTPSLTAFKIKEEWSKALSGLSFKDTKLRIKASRTYEYSGPFLFTHKGVSGPAIFAISSLSAFENFTEESPAKLLIDFVPNKTYEELNKLILENIQKSPKKSVFYFMSDFLPKSLAKTISEILQIDNKPFSFLSKKDINHITEALKNTTLTITGRETGGEFVTAGGVDLIGVNKKTMESKICSGLYFAGEILDIDGFTGGFNLQFAWATGKLAGENLSE
jgi:hypothetical protein